MFRNACALRCRLGSDSHVKEIGADNKMELVLISLLAAFCGGLAWALDHELFDVAFAAAAVTQAFGAVAALVGTGRSPPNFGAICRREGHFLTFPVET